MVDYTGLNKYVQRPLWPFPWCQDVMDQISPDSKYFAALDCSAGYHQIKLDQQESEAHNFHPAEREIFIQKGAYGVERFF